MLVVCADHPYGLAIRLALMGLRRSELSGLRWTDFNAQTGTLLIARQMQRIDKQWVAVTPKDDSGRLLMLSAKLTAALGASRAAQAELRALMDWPDGGYLFVSQLNGGGGQTPPISIKTISMRGYSTGAPARLPAHRRTALLASGEDSATVTDILGHASPHVTATNYAHALPHKVASALQRLEDVYDQSCASGYDFGYG